MTTSDAHYDIAISGASFAGLALARGLSQAMGGTVRIAIIDRAIGPPAPERDTRAFAIWAGAKTVLEGLGVWSVLADHAEAMTSIEISDSALGDGVRPTRLTYDAKTEDGRPAAHMVPSGVLLQALYQSVANDPAITFVAPAEATSVSLGEFSADVMLKMFFVDSSTRPFTHPPTSSF